MTEPAASPSTMNRCEVMPGACVLRDGYAYPNEAPGLGLDINEELAAKYPYQENWMPLVRRADGTVHVY